jgi:hypothetical protein
MCPNESDYDETDHSLYRLIGMLDEAEVEQVREASRRFRESAIHRRK